MSKARDRLYRFDLDCGRMGDLTGMFVADEREIRAAIGKACHFGEVLGKHSDISCTLKAEHFTILTDDAAFIAQATRYGLIPTGFNPLGVLADAAADARSARRWEREHPNG